MCDSGSPRVYSLPDTKPGSFPSDPLIRSSRWFGIAHDLAGSLAPLQISGRERKDLPNCLLQPRSWLGEPRKIGAQRLIGNVRGSDGPAPDGTTVGVAPQNRAERPIHHDQRSEGNRREAHEISHHKPVEPGREPPPQNRLSQQRERPSLKLVEPARERQRTAESKPPLASGDQARPQDPDLPRHGFDTTRSQSEQAGSTSFDTTGPAPRTPTSPHDAAHPTAQHTSRSCCCAHSLGPPRRAVEPPRFVHGKGRVR